VSAATVSARAALGPREGLDAYRDDGPLARALGHFLGPLTPLPPVVLLVAAIAPLAAVLATMGPADGRMTIGAALVWCIVLGGASTGRRHTGRFVWIVPALLRLLEYGTLLGFALLGGLGALSAAFALGGALAWHHYDTVYRLRHQGVSPPGWLFALTGGWDGRLLLAFILFMAGELATGLLVAAIVLGALVLVESTASWLRFEHAERPALYADDEDEDA
jgi:hypothetical protein